MIKLNSLKLFQDLSNKITKLNGHHILGGVDKCTGGGFKRNSDGSYRSWSDDAIMNYGESYEYTIYYLDD